MKIIIDWVGKFVLCLVVYVSIRITLDWVGVAEDLSASIAGGFLVGTMYEIGVCKIYKEE